MCLGISGSPWYSFLNLEKVMPQGGWETCEVEQNLSRYESETKPSQPTAWNRATQFSPA